MKILGIKTLSGPNVFHHRPVLLLELDLEEWTERSSAELPGFWPRLLEVLPGLAQHHCSPGRVGGFVERLERGTYFAHIIEHVTLELSTLAGIGVGYGKSIYNGGPGLYKVAIRYLSEDGMKFLLTRAVALVDALARGHEFAVGPVIAEARKIVQRTELGPSTRAIVAAAERRNIPWERLNDDNLLQLGYGRERKHIQATTSSCTSDIAVDIAQDKDFTKKILAKASLRVPAGEIVCSAEEAVEAFTRLGVPVAVKPLDGHHGNGVSLGADSAEAVRRAFGAAAEHSRAVLVEELFVGQDFRVLVVGGKMIAAACRVPASVVGDGVRTVSELVEAENLNPLRGEGHEKAMTRIVMNEVAEEYLARKGKTPHTVPAAGEKVFLRETANLSQGGHAIDVTDDVHPEIRIACERTARIVGLDICGVDLVLQSISEPLSEQRGGIIEVNAGPGIRMHHFPSEGKPRDVGEAIVESLFPAPSEGRIPILSITGTNGKTTVTRLAGHLLAEAGWSVGMTTSDGIYLGHDRVAKGDTTGPISARAILCDPGVGVAVLETARGGIVRRGLGYDWSDVGVITNIQPDHIGQDGIETLEDILRIKTLVAERVRAGGTLVLNADDPHLGAVAEKEKTGRNLVFFSLAESSELLRRHRSEGGRAYFLREGRILEATGEEEVPVIAAAEIPLTYGGTAQFQIANAMAAVASCRAVGLPLRDCLSGLRSFDPGKNNSGRANVYRIGRGYLLVDYGHNPDAFRAIGEMTSRWNVPRVTGVIAVPGDRSDEMLRLAARAAANAFDRVVIREDLDLRGRPSGEAARILCAAVQEEVPGMACLTELDESRALDLAVSQMLEGEIIAFFYDDLQLMKTLLARHHAEPLADFGEIGARAVPAVRQAG